MGLFRATIQHRRKVRLLVSGVAPFHELGALWNDHFINVRELHLGYLDEPASLGLLMKPFPGFPDDAISRSVAELIFQRTGGQPNLLQLYASTLIEWLNEHKRLQARPEDIAAIEPQVFDDGAYYFRNTIQDAIPEAREVLVALAEGESPTYDVATRRWLRQRLLLTEDGSLAVPVLATWIHDVYER